MFRICRCSCTTTLLWALRFVDDLLLGAYNICQMGKPAYALVGADSFLQLEKLAEIVRALPADTQRVDVDGERAELSEVLDELRSYAMFGGAKLVVVRNADEFVSRFREPLERYLQSPSDSATLVLRLGSFPGNTRIAKLMAKVGVVDKCEPPGRGQLPAWITHRAKTVHNLPLAADASKLLADLIGDDMGKLDNELARLALSSDGKKPLTAAAMAGTVAFQREQQMWDMTNAIGAGQGEEALKRWRQMVQMDGSVEFRAVTWLGIWLENVQKLLLAIDQGQNPFSLMPSMRVFDQTMQKGFVATAKSLGGAGLKRAVDLLAEVDWHSKSGRGDAAGNVERFLLMVASMTSARSGSQARVSEPIR